MNLSLLKRKILNKGALWISLFKLRPLLKNLDENSVVIDCGANVGDISEQFAKTGAKVYAFEPDPMAFSRLQKRFEQMPNVELRQQAVWTQDTQLPFFVHQDRKGEEIELTVSSSLKAEKVNVKSSDAISVEAIDLVKFIQDLEQKVDLVKMDIEGAEIEVLNKIIEHEAYSKFILAVVETHETKIPGHKEEVEKLKRMFEEKGITNIKLNWI